MRRLGAVYPMALLIIGLVLLVMGVIEPATNWATAGSVMLSGVLVAMSAGPDGRTGD